MDPTETTAPWPDGSAPAGSGADPRDLASMERLDRRVVVYWLLTGTLGAVVLLVVLGAGAFFVRRQWPEWGDLALAGAIVLGGTNLLWALISPALAYARWRFDVDGEMMRMRYGVIFHEERHIPINRLQHVDLTRGPVERLFGLASLVVYSAGNEGSAFRVPGVAVRRARELRDQILAARGDDVL